MKHAGCYPEPEKTLPGCEIDIISRAKYCKAWRSQPLSLELYLWLTRCFQIGFIPSFRIPFAIGYSSRSFRMATSIERPIEPNSHLSYERNERNLTPKNYDDPTNSTESGHNTGNGEAKSSSTKKSYRKKQPTKKDTQSKSEKPKLVKEKRSNGSLVSVARDADYEESLELDELEKKSSGKKKGSTLVSGREAGAGWERSG